MTTTFLQATNDVLLRLRESSVATIATTPYATLIAKFVNDAKVQAESAWNWEALVTTLTLTTASGTSEYTLTGSGFRHKGISVNNVTSGGVLTNVPLAFIRQQSQLSTVSNNTPEYYAWSGSNGTDSKVTLYPTPNATESIKFNMYVPQVALVNDSDVILIPSGAVVAGAYARALVERGEDGGLSASEAYGLYTGILSDLIALEASRSVDMDWVAC